MKIAFIDWKDSYGELYVDDANEKLKADDIHVTVHTHPSVSDIVYNLDRKHCDAIVIPFYYDGEAVMHTINAFTDFRPVYYLPSNDAINIDLPAYYEKSTNNVTVMSSANLDTLEGFTAAFREVSRDFYKDMPVLEGSADLTEPWKIGFMPQRNDEFTEQFRDYFKTPDCPSKFVEITCAREALDSQDVCDMILLYVTDPLLESWHEALLEVDIPIYVVYTGSYSRIKEYLRALATMNYCLDYKDCSGYQKVPAKEVVAALIEHHRMGSRDENVQEMYKLQFDIEYKYYVFISKECRSNGDYCYVLQHHDELPDNDVLVSAIFAETNQSPKEFACAFYNNLVVKCGKIPKNPSVSILLLACFDFLATFIKAEYGSDKHKNLLIDLCSREYKSVSSCAGDITKICYAQCS